MRYTTIIDITEYPGLYTNANCRLVYLHLVLRSGYHDDDRDMIKISLRRLAMVTGITVAATRHALAQLAKSGLITRTVSGWQVKKFVMTEEPTKRAKTKREMAEQLAVMERQRQEQLRQQDIAERQQAVHQDITQNEAYQRIQKRFGLTKKDKT